jgi:predicted permease
VTLNPLGTSAWQMTHRSGNWLNVLGRLGPGVTRERASQDVNTVMQRLVAAYPDDHLGNNTITLDPMWRSPFGANGYMAATLPILLAIAGVVLLLTCANVATLTLVRFVSRRHEIAIRQSLGATRVKITLQMVLEGVMISLIAGTAALLMTSWTAKTFALFIPPNSNPIVLNGVLDHHVVVAIVVLAIAASVLCGALPAWRSSHVPAAEVLKEESASISGSARNRHLLSGLVVTQIALSLALLVSSALFLRTLRNLRDASSGLEPDHVLTASVGLNIAGYTDGEAAVTRRKVLDRVSTLRGVKVASLTDWIPMSFTRKTFDAVPDGHMPRPHEWFEVRRAEVTPRYFETLGIPIIEGRDFTQTDTEKAPRVIIVDQTAANRYWPGQDPIGKKLIIWGHSFVVVGVVRNSKHQFLSESPEPMIYRCFYQYADNETIVQVRTIGNPGDLAPAVEAAIHEINAQLPVFDIRPLRETMQMANIFAVMQSTFAGMFAVIALLLAATGIYGVVAYRTQLRTHEIGVRMALGASRANVIRLVVGQGLWLTLTGLALGLLLSSALTRFIAQQLYGVSPNDPSTVLGVVVLLTAMSLVACWFPARRAMRQNPVTAIREL